MNTSFWKCKHTWKKKALITPNGVWLVEQLVNLARWLISATLALLMTLWCIAAFGMPSLSCHLLMDWLQAYLWKLSFSSRQILTLPMTLKQPLVCLLFQCWWWRSPWKLPIFFSQGAFGYELLRHSTHALSWFFNNLAVQLLAFEKFWSSVPLM